MNEIELDQNEVYEVLQNIPIKSKEKLFQIRKTKFNINIIYNLSKELQQIEDPNLDKIKKEINQLPVEKEIIVCDIIQLSNSTFFVLCINSIIIIINKVNIPYLNQFFAKTSNIHFLNENSEQEFTSKFPKIKQSYSNLFSMDDIEVFESKLHFHATKGNDFFLKLIKPTVTGYILLKSFIQTKIYRHKKNEISTKSEYLYDDFIFIRNEGNSSNLYFNVNDQLLYILKKFNTNDFTSKRRYEREIECYQKVDNKHPYISKYFGEFKFHDNKYIVIEYIEGSTLKMLKSKNEKKINLNFEEKIKIILQILMAVEYFHSKGIILRDLKWDNIIVDSSNDCFLIDFDCSKHYISDFDEMTSDIGSNLFSAPEQLMGNDYLYQVDLFAVGMIINFIINEKYIEAKEFLEDLNNEIPNFDGTFLFLTSLYRHLLSNSPEKRPNISTVLNNFLIKIPDYIQMKNILDKENKIHELIQKFIKIRCEILLEIINDKSYSSSSFADFSEIYNFLGVMYNKGEQVEKNIEKSLYFLNLSANLNNSNAQCNLGLFYSNGLNIKPDIEKALYYLNLSAEQNNSKALYNLGCIYFEGNLVQKDIYKANYYFSLAGNTEDYSSFINLGNHYQFKYPYDIQRSIYYFSRASKLHCAITQINLGYIYLSNDKIQRDIDKSIHYFSLAMNQNHPLAKIIFGFSDPKKELLNSNFGDVFNNMMSFCMKTMINFKGTKSLLYFAIQYYCGDLKTRNIHLAFYYFNILAEKNDPIAQFYLGKIYIENKILQDINKGVLNLVLSSNNNYSPAQYLLGVYYYFGKYLNRDIGKSIHYLTLSANNNNSDAQYFLGFLYLFEKDVTKDVNKSLYYLNLSANQNNSKAQYLIGIINMNNQYVPCDINKSIHYLTLAANQNNPYAQAQLGLFYCTENIDIKKSLYYLNLSSSQNYGYSYFILGKIYYFGTHVNQDINKAIHYFILASKRYVSDANYYLGLIYYEGKYLFQNIDKAIHYLTLSAKENNSEAQSLLGQIYYHKKEMKKCFYYLNLASKQNNPLADYFLGVLFFKGKYISKNLNKAIHFFKKAANLNISSARNNLGCIYLNLNISLSIEYFDENIRKNEDALSIVNLAKIFYFGINNCERNVQKAIQLLKIAFKQKVFLSDLFLFLILYKENLDESKSYYELICNKYSNYFLMKFLDMKKCENALNLYQNMIFDYGLSIKHVLNFIGKFIDVDFSLPKENKTNVVDYIHKENINSDFYEGFGL